MFCRPVDDLEGVASLLLTPGRGKDLIEPTPLLASSIVLCFVPASQNRRCGQRGNFDPEAVPEGNMRSAVCKVKLFVLLLEVAAASVKCWPGVIQTP